MMGVTTSPSGATVMAGPHGSETQPYPMGQYYVAAPMPGQPAQYPGGYAMQPMPNGGYAPPQYPGQLPPQYPSQPSPYTMQPAAYAAQPPTPYPASSYYPSPARASVSYGGDALPGQVAQPQYSASASNPLAGSAADASTGGQDNKPPPPAYQD